MIKIAIAIIIVVWCPVNTRAQRQSVVNNYLQLAAQQVEQNQEEKALPYLDTVIYKQPYNKEALFLRGRIYSNLHEYQHALTDYLRLTEIDPENKEATYSLGVVRYQMGQYNMAITDFQKCLKAASQPTNTAFFKIDPWNKKAMDISTITHMDAEIWNFIGLCLYHLDEFEAAISAFTEGLKTDKNYVDLLVNRALGYEALGEHDLARTDYTTALLISPDHETASLNLLRLQSEDERLESLNTFIASNPDHPQGYANRGLLHFSNSNYQAAEGDLTAAFELNPENNDYLFNLALSKLKTGKLTESEELFMELIDREPKRAGAYFNIGNIHFTQKSFDTACSYYSIAIQLQPNMPVYLYNRALAFYENDQRDKACEDMRLAHLLDPAIGNDFLIKYCSFD